MSNLILRRALMAVVALIAVTQVALFTYDMTERLDALTGSQPDQAPWSLG